MVSLVLQHFIDLAAVSIIAKRRATIWLENANSGMVIFRAFQYEESHLIPKGAAASLVFRATSFALLAVRVLRCKHGPFVG